MPILHFPHAKAFPFSLRNFRVRRWGRSVRASLLSLIWRGQLVLQIRQERRRLAELSDQALSDVGLARSAAVAESNRSWLDLPKNRAQTSLQCEQEADWQKR